MGATPDGTAAVRVDCLSMCVQIANRMFAKPQQKFRKERLFRLLDARIQPEGHLSSVEPAGALASQWAAKRPRRFFSRRLVLAVSSVARHSPERDEGCSYRGVSRPSFPSRSNTAWVTTESKAARRPRTSRKPAWFLMPGKGLEPLRLQRRHLILSQARMTSFATPAGQG